MSSDEVGLQMAILQVAADRQGSSPGEVHQALLGELAARSLPVPPGTWLSGVISSILQGAPYVVSPTAIAGCEEQLGIVPTTDHSESDARSRSSADAKKPKSLEQHSGEVWPESDRKRISVIIRALRDD